MKKLSGFTLMELMVVIAIILSLSIAITATLSVSFEKAKKGKATAEMAEIATACKMYYKDTGAWPLYIRSLFDTYYYYGYNPYGQQGSWVYFDVSKWKGPYLMTFKTYSEIKDPWGYTYEIFRDTSEPNVKLYVRSPGSNPSDATKRLKVLVHRFKKP